VAFKTENSPGSGEYELWDFKSGAADQVITTIYSVVPVAAKIADGTTRSGSPRFGVDYAGTLISGTAPAAGQWVFDAAKSSVTSVAASETTDGVITRVTSTKAQDVWTASKSSPVVAGIYVKSDPADLTLKLEDTTINFEAAAATMAGASLLAAAAALFF
jgi:hypothetical protein